MADEARTMEYARQHGVPVPAIHEISDDGTEMVMERVNGPSMGDVVTHKPWLIRSQGRLLAYKSPGCEAIDASLKDSDGTFYGTQVIAMPS